MPKDEFDFEDPLELNGVAFLTPEDSTREMAETFIEEFLRMGHDPQQILALFRNPHYLGPNMALERLGEPNVCDLVTEVFARWGRVPNWQGSAGTGPQGAVDAPYAVAEPNVGGAPFQPSQSDVLTDPMGGPIPDLDR